MAVVNAEAEQMFGYRNELINRSVDMLVPERLRPQYVRLPAADIVRRPASCAGTCSGCARRQRFRRRSASTRSGPEGPMVLGVVVDISERMQMGQQDSRLHVSHELRTPLTSTRLHRALGGTARIQLPATANA